MSMLAEPRRKQKWSVDPRNSAWSKDESKFGQKMLEKMGWSKGKGLGAQEQGNTEHIKVQLKNNTLGLGASVSQEDNWIAHQDDFNQLLADLNGCHGQHVPEASSREEKKTFSLEQKSKTSRKRVHYVKFAKGKDLSSRSEDDLSCIFGKRQIKKTQVDATNPDSPEEDPKEENEPPEEVDMSNTVTSALSVQEYFAKRMAQLKKAQRRVSSVSGAALGSQSKKKKSHKPSGLENEGGEPRATLGSSGEEVDEPETQKKKKKKRKKKKKKKKNSQHSAIDGSLTCNVAPQGTQESGSCFFGTSDEGKGDLEDPRPKKKKKRKYRNIDRDAAEDAGSTKPKKKKRSS
ncbi:PIN2/TERF1-interacting telomerase inhibitor 1 [Elgaria multicarinata webbii]|uniref:PIN2/TERF1-interacting telomerase inhibitor 1 n=1 Tax=Elgaria multicarinata webbii TaxID=159646 RepID=UPI002FCCF499